MSDRRCEHDTTTSTIRDTDQDGQPIEYQVCDRCDCAVEAP